ncbi:ATP-binding protein [Streptomyces sp. NPDC055815]
MAAQDAAPPLRDRLSAWFEGGARVPGHRPDLRTTDHQVMARRALHGFYRWTALCRLVSAVLWTGCGLAAVRGGGSVGAAPVLVAGAVASVGALAAWSHHHDGALEWMGERRPLRGFASYLSRTARERRVTLDVPGVTEGAGVVAMGLVTAWSAPSGPPPLAWSAAFTLLLLYLPFAQYVIDPAWYAPELARSAPYAWARLLLPVLLAAAGYTVYRLAAPPGATGPDGALVLWGAVVRVYVDVTLVDSLLSALGPALRDERKDLADVVSSAVHSKVKNEFRVLGTLLDLDEQSDEVQARWHSLVHQVESLRCDPFREGDRTGLDEIVADVLSTCRAFSAAPETLVVTAEHSGTGGHPLRPTDLDLLESVLSDLCVNAVREANRLRAPEFDIRISLAVTPEAGRRRVSVMVTDDGRGFDGASSMSRRGSSLAVLDRRLRKRGGRIEVAAAPGGGAVVRGTWFAL